MTAGPAIVMPIENVSNRDESGRHLDEPGRHWGKSGLTLTGGVPVQPMESQFTTVPSRLPWFGPDHPGLSW